MNKSQFEQALDATSIRPAYRTQLNGQELFVADGFIAPAQLQYLTRFGVKATSEEYPFGCYATIWYAPRRVGWCGICVFDAMHDPVKSQEAKQSLRIKAAIYKAVEDHKRRDGNGTVH